MSEYAIPNHVEEAVSFLRENLVGEVFPKRYQSIIGHFVLESALRPGSALEDLSLTLLKRRFKSTNIQLEPYGKETFPDIMLGFSGQEKYYFEVKSKASELRKLDVDLASVKQLFTYTSQGDPRYWETWYLLWTYQEQGNHVKVIGLETGQLWELVGRHENGTCKTGSGGAGRTKYLQRGQNVFATPEEFMDGLIKTYSGMGYSAKEVNMLRKGAQKIVEKLPNRKITHD